MSHGVHAQCKNPRLDRRGDACPGSSIEVAKAGGRAAPFPYLLYAWRTVSCCNVVEGVSTKVRDKSFFSLGFGCPSNDLRPTYVERAHGGRAERGRDGGRERARRCRLGDARQHSDLDGAEALGVGLGLGALHVLIRDDCGAAGPLRRHRLAVGLDTRADGGLVQREVGPERDGQVGVRPSGGVLGHEGERVAHELAGLDGGLGGLARNYDGLRAAGRCVVLCVWGTRRQAKEGLRYLWKEGYTGGAKMKRARSMRRSILYPPLTTHEFSVKGKVRASNCIPQVCGVGGVARAAVDVVPIRVRVRIQDYGCDLALVKCIIAHPKDVSPVGALV